MSGVDAPKAPSALVLGVGAGKFLDVRNSSNATILRVDESTGNIGIGTANPSRPLEIANGKLRFSDDFGDIEFTESADLLSHVTQTTPIGTEPAFRVATGTSLTQLLTVLNDGRVGIGIDNPAAPYKLQVIGSSGGISASGINAYGVIGSNGGTNEILAGILGLGNSAISNGAIAAKFRGKLRIENFGAQPGDLRVEGTLTKAGGSFKIDHPLDPENKYLYHSFVESPDMKDIYDGTVTTDENGQAVVQLPEWFEALNRDFRYQLTVIGTFAQAIVAEKIKDNRFTLKTSIPNVEVSWLVTGIRRDAWANKNRIPVEEEKPEKERGYYLHPAAFDLGPEKGIQDPRDLELTQRPEQQRNAMQQLTKRSPDHP